MYNKEKANLFLIFDLIQVCIVTYSFHRKWYSFVCGVFLFYILRIYNAQYVTSFIKK